MTDLIKQVRARRQRAFVVDATFGQGSHGKECRICLADDYRGELVHEPWCAPIRTLIEHKIDADPAELREHDGDLWQIDDADVFCILTNGTTISGGLRKGHNPMGGGVALEAAIRYPWLPEWHGRMISRYGVHAYLAPATGTCGLVMFPTKPDLAGPATLERIAQSIHETKQLADVYGWTTIALPRPGAGLGGLDWNTIRPTIAQHVDERFLIVHKDTPPLPTAGHIEGLYTRTDDERTVH